uniref:Uncharacterized protein n=1 Tax=Rhizophora mucronata TaxID=61149 RepID=A0A2P2NAP0_RHIMU
MLLREALQGALAS